MSDSFVTNALVTFIGEGGVRVQHGIAEGGVRVQHGIAEGGVRVQHGIAEGCVHVQHGIAEGVSVYSMALLRGCPCTAWHC